MSTSTIAVQRRLPLILGRVADYIELTKPKIAVLVLVTVAVSGYIAVWGQPNPIVVLHTLVGTLLVAASASALNQLLERRSDALMERTSQRPLPAGRLHCAEVILFASICIIAGIIYLTVLVNAVTALLGVATWVVYVWIYTPLKTRTPLNTAVGAVSGALPVLMGWFAMNPTLDSWSLLRAAALFLIVFLWQFPHFMAIAWLYRKQYARADMRMMPVVDPSGRRAGVQAITAALALLPVSLIPGLCVPGAAPYAAVALLLSIGQLVCAGLFLSRMNERSARRLLRASLVYLPALLGAIMFIPSM